MFAKPYVYVVNGTGLSLGLESAQKETVSCSLKSGIEKCKRSGSRLCRPWMRVQDRLSALRTSVLAWQRNDSGGERHGVLSCREHARQRHDAGMARQRQSVQLRHIKARALP